MSRARPMPNCYRKKRCVDATCGGCRPLSSTPAKSEQRAEACHGTGNERALTRREVGEPGVEGSLCRRERGSESPLPGPGQPEPQPPAVARGGEPDHEPPTRERIDQRGRAG